MKKAFEAFFGRFIHLSDKELEAIGSIVTYRKVRKKEHFIMAGTVCSKVLFTNRGYFRFYHLDSNGNEITSDFYFAPNFITSYTSFITGKPSLINVQAMMDMEVAELNKKDLYDLYHRYPNIERAGRLIAETIAINSEEHLFMLLNQTAETRYKTLMEKYPEYVNTIPLQYIASYLGITKETLSRIRKSIR